MNSLIAGISLICAIVAMMCIITYFERRQKGPDWPWWDEFDWDRDLPDEPPGHSVLLTLKEEEKVGSV